MRWLFDKIFEIKGKKKQKAAEHVRYAATGFSVLGICALLVGICLLYVYCSAYPGLMYYPDVTTVIYILGSIAGISTLVGIWAALCCVIDLLEKLVKRILYTIVNGIYVFTKRIHRFTSSILRAVS